MAITARILAATGKLPAIILLLLITAVTWSTIHSGGPQLSDLVFQNIVRYDRLFPEITIHEGTASVKGEQPIRVDTKDPNFIIVIDTREDQVNSYPDYLKNADFGAVLTKTNLVIKNDSRIQMIPLKEAPDFVVNSKNLESLAKQFQYPVGAGLRAFVALYFLIAKPLQMLFMAVIALFVARILSLSLTFGEACKLAVIGMIPPVLLDVMYGALDKGISAGILSYIGVYILSMAILFVDLYQNPVIPEDPYADPL